MNDDDPLSADHVALLDFPPLPLFPCTTSILTINILSPGFQKKTFNLFEIFGKCCKAFECCCWGYICIEATRERQIIVWDTRRMFLFFYSGRKDAFRQMGAADSPRASNSYGNWKGKWKTVRILSVYHCWDLYICFMWKFSYLLLQSSDGFTRRSVPVTGWFHQILERVITVDVFGVVACSSGLIKVKARRAELGKRTKMQICDYFVFMEHEKGKSYNQSGTTVHADVVAATVARIRIVSVERRTSERPWAWGRLACCGLSRRLSRRLRSWLRSRLRSRICSRWCSRACGCHWLRSRLCGRLGSCAAGGGRIC